jgi:membrane protease YdiL (CAAX protease family)
MTFVGGIILGYSYEKTESLFVPMISHGAYNAFLGLTMLF